MTVAYKRRGAGTIRPGGASLLAAAPRVVTEICGEVGSSCRGQVVASGDQMNKVAAEALRKTGSGLMYVKLVGGEDVVLRVRRAA